MKKNKLTQALSSGLDVEELHDPGLRSITGGCGPMEVNYLCGPVFERSVGEGIAEATCPAKPIFTGTTGREF